MIITAMTTAVVAQQPAQKDYKKERAEWEKRVKDELKLTGDQVAKYDAACKDFNDKVDALMQDGTLDKAAQKERKETLKKEKEARLAEFLTPEQQAKYRELMAEKKKEMGKPSGSQ